MQHVLFAIFDTEMSANSCLQALQALPNVTVVVHRDKVNRDDVKIEETSAREGVITGALIGAAVGGSLGAILSGPIDIVPVEPIIGALFGALGGSGAGALGGGLMGTGHPDPVLKEVEQEVRNGKVLLTIEIEPREKEVDDIERLCRSHNGRIARKPVIGFWTDRLRPRRRAHQTL